MNSCASWRLIPARRRQPEVAHPVGEPEVDHLGHRPLVGGDVRGVLAQHPGRGLAVDVGLARERVGEVLVARHVGEDPELDLAVVGGDERRVRRAGDERVPDPPAERRPDRDVLEVGVRRRQPPGRRHGLVEQRVQAPVGPDQRRQRLDVGRAELGVDPPLEDRLDRRVDAAQLLEHGRVRRVAGLRPAALGQPQLDEQDVAQLLGRADRELVADGRVDLALEAARSRRRTRARAPRARPGRARCRRPPCGRGSGSAAARPRRTAGRRPRRAAPARATAGRRATTAPRGPRSRRAAGPRPRAAARGPAAPRRRRRSSGPAARR